MLISAMFHGKVNIFTFSTVAQTKQDILRRHPGLWLLSFSPFSDILLTKRLIDWMLTGPFKHMKLLRSPWSAINGQMSSLEYLRTGHLPSKSTWEDGCCMKREDGERSGPFIDWQNYNVFSLKQQLLLCDKRSITLNADTFLENILYWFLHKNSSFCIRTHCGAHFEQRPINYIHHYLIYDSSLSGGR